MCAGVCARALMPRHEGGGQGRQGLTATATGLADPSIQEGSQSPLPILLYVSSALRSHLPGPCL